MFRNVANMFPNTIFPWPAPLHFVDFMPMSTLRHDYYASSYMHSPSSAHSQLKTEINSHI